jgi:thiamine biosynthesis lipoprotein
MKKASAIRDKSMDRRSFLKMSCIAALGLAAAGISPLWAEDRGPADKVNRVSRTGLAMGTTVSMTLVCQPVERAEGAMDLAFRDIDRLAGLMNRFDDRSPIARLNRQGRLNNADPDIVNVITAALKYYRLTGGAFDITITPVLDLFQEKFSKSKNPYPTEKEIEKALSLVGSNRIELRGSSIRFKKPGMSITLDGIAKGYIVDRASRILLKQDIKNHLINAGGDILAMGLRDDGNPWKVGILDPKKRKNYVDIITLTNAAVATSGNYENYFDREKIFHHIVNPKTGKSPVVNIGASVIAPTAMEADALATSMLVMSPDEGIRFMDSLPGYESLIITRRNQIRRSSGWKSTSMSQAS